MLESIEALLEECRQCGVALAPGRGGKLRVSPPPEQLPKELLTALKQHKTAVLAAMARQPHPYLTSRGELIIPHNSVAKYHWWNGGQSIHQTLRELGANHDIVARYVDGDMTVKH